MRFTVAWANVLSQNITLRMAVIALSICSLFFGIVAARLALRDPFVIDRGCFSKAASPTDAKHTDQEIFGFLQVAIPARYDSSVADYKPYLSDRELTARLNEQEEFSKKGIVQRIVVNSAKSDKGDFVVDADKVIGVGKVRSALPLPLKVELRSVSRSHINPYGLVLHRVYPLEAGDSK